MSAVLAGERITVTFDKPLVSQALSAANWVAEFGGVVPLDAVKLGAAGVRLSFATTPDVSTVSYLASPADVVGTNGLAVEAFADFPVT